VTSFPSPAASDIVVPADLRQAVVDSEADFCRRVRREDPERTIDALIDGRKGAFELIAPFVAGFATPRILEIGSGNGFGLCYLLKRGLDVVGIEPGAGYPFAGRFERARRLLAANDIPDVEQRLLPGAGECLPFPSDSFHIVFNNAVLEHVADVASNVREAFRVLRPGGVIVMNVPNYDSFYEGHYDCFWIPYLLRSRRVARWYVARLLRRWPGYLDELQFTTPRGVLPLFAALGHLAETTVFYFCLRPFHWLSAAYYYFVTGFASRRRLIAMVRAAGLAAACRALLKPLLGALAALGLAIEFRVVCRKRDGPAVPS
jgi:SAM-dependent methyltransferase